MADTESSGRNSRVFALAGAGTQAMEFAPVLQVLAEEGLIEFVACADPSEAAARFAVEFGLRWYRTIEELLESEPTVGSVVIATPPEFHAALALPALEAGVNVYVEIFADSFRTDVEIFADSVRTVDTAMLVIDWRGGRRAVLRLPWGAAVDEAAVDEDTLGVTLEGLRGKIEVRIRFHE